MPRTHPRPVAHEPVLVQVPHGRARHVIGWTEHIALPAWGIRRLRAKIDTGARTSALHVQNVELVGPGRVRFDVVLARREGGRKKTIESDVVRQMRVRSSTGHWQWRYTVHTLVRLGTVEKSIEVSLASRERMRYRMLLGRVALGADFLVDASRRMLVSGEVTRRPPKASGSP